jgi:phage baseplate assembly protein W
LQPNKNGEIWMFFKAHPITGDVTVKTDTDAVKRSVKNIVLTNHFERPFKPNFGGSVRDLLFELNTSRKLRKVQKRLKDTIEAFEPRVEDVQVILANEDSNELNITIHYSIKNSTRKQQVDFTVTRTR